MKQLIARAQHFITEHKLIGPESTVILGISGGPDSVFLFHALLQLQDKLHFKLVAAHLNHGWRAEAAEDEAFCKKLAEQHNIQFISLHAQNLTLTRKQPRSLEARGRALRRAFFEKCTEQHPQALIALAHHADDQIETFFIRLLRGATVSGLKGMLPQSGCYIRPLLTITKNEILAALEQQQIQYCIDASNNSDLFLRNRIRRHLLPALAQCDARNNALARSLQNIYEAHAFIDSIVKITVSECIINSAQEVTLHYYTLFSRHTYLHNAVILEWIIQAQIPFTPSTALLEEIKRFLQYSSASSHTLYQSWLITKNHQTASITLIS